MSLHNTSHAPGFLKAALPWLGLGAGLAMALCQWVIFIYAPVADGAGLPQKIIYLHIPLAWWGMLSFFTVFVASIVYLKNRSPRMDALAGAAAETGIVLTFLALVCGMFWAKPAWNTWWTWDPRLTTTLILCFVYAAYLIVRRMDLAPERRSLVAAVIGIAAFLDVPLVYFSARLWNGIHPPSIGLEPEMNTAVIASTACFSLLWIGLVGLRWRLALDEHRLAAMIRDRLLRNE